MTKPYVFVNAGPDGAPVLFRDPVATISAHNPDEVSDALSALARAQGDGYWLAGFCAYELGYLLDAKLASLLPKNRQGPLLRFGVFEVPSTDGARSFLAKAERDEPHSTLGKLEPLWTETEYGQAFARVKDYIAAGDIYQANLTFPMRTRYEGAPPGLYAALQQAQPVPHGAIVDLGGGPVVVSCSPELFFDVESDGAIETRPMKGTAPRGQTPDEDQRLCDFLRADPKNRAENLMIVDLLRNDLGRIAETGSVHVPELAAVESYATVHQMISRVRARLRPGTGLADILRALFPCGSITGAPKIRAMEIIRELEPEARDAYCGAIGWAAPDGRARFNVAIRTLSLSDDGTATLNVGGAVTYESEAAAEYEEALWKARYAKLPQTTCG